MEVFKWITQREPHPNLTTLPPLASIITLLSPIVQSCTIIHKRKCDLCFSEELPFDRFSNKTQISSCNFIAARRPPVWGIKMKHCLCLKRAFCLQSLVWKLLSVTERSRSIYSSSIRSKVHTGQSHKMVSGEWGEHKDRNSLFLSARQAPHTAFKPQEWNKRSRRPSH